MLRLRRGILLKLVHGTLLRFMVMRLLQGTGVIVLAMGCDTSRNRCIPCEHCTQQLSMQLHHDSSSSCCSCEGAEDQG